MYFWPQMGNTVNLLVWLTPLVALVFFMFMGTLIAAHGLYQKRDREASAREQELQAEISRLKDRLEARGILGAQRQEIETQLGLLDEREKQLVKLLLVKSRLNESQITTELQATGHGISAGGETTNFMNRLKSRTSFLTRDFSGDWQITPEARSVLADLHS